MIKDSPNPPEKLFTVRPDLGTETLLVNASQDLSSITDIASPELCPGEGEPLMLTAG